MVEIIKELKTLDSDTIFGLGFFTCLIIFIFLQGIAQIVKNFKNK